MIWTQLYIYSRKLCHFITILYFRYVARVSTDACALNMLGILLERQRHFRTAKRFTVADFFIWNPLKNSQFYSLALENFVGFLKYSWCLKVSRSRNKIVMPKLVPPKKRTNEFVFLSWLPLRIENQIHSFVFWENLRFNNFVSKSTDL